MVSELQEEDVLTELSLESVEENLEETGCPRQHQKDRQRGKGGFPAKQERDQRIKIMFLGQRQRD